MSQGSMIVFVDIFVLVQNCQKKSKQAKIGKNWQIGHKMSKFP